MEKKIRWENLTRREGIYEESIKEHSKSRVANYVPGTTRLISYDIVTYKFILVNYRD